VHVVREHPLAVDLHHREPLPIPSFELRIAADVDLLELERMTDTNVVEHRARPLAEVAPDRGEERNASAYG
jgi:hypothetical protein